MMKQGQGVTSMNGAKREPIAHAINPGYAGELGNMVVQNPTPMSAGRGFTAPEPVAETNHPCGSQGVHK